MDKLYENVRIIGSFCVSQSVSPVFVCDKVSCCNYVFNHLHVGRLGDNQEVKDSSLGDSKCLTVKRQLPTVW